MKLSQLLEGDVGRLVRGGQKFIVTWRTAEDRVSGSTRVTMGNGGVRDYLWDDDNPEVEKLGRGRLLSRIIMETDEQE